MFFRARVVFVPVGRHEKVEEPSVMQVDATFFYERGKGPGTDWQEAVVSRLDENITVADIDNDGRLGSWPIRRRRLEVIGPPKTYPFCRASRPTKPRNACSPRR